jgi:hypothetical protein
MPRSQRDTIVGGGLTPVAPSTQYTIPMFADNIPDFLTDSIAREVLAVGGNVTHITIGPNDPPPRGTNPAETFRLGGGFICQYNSRIGSVCIGEQAVVNAGSNTIAPAVVIGLGAAGSGTGGSGQGSVVIGYQANDGVIGQPPSVVIGGQANATAGNMIAIGVSAIAQGGNGMVIGNGSTQANSTGGLVIGMASFQAAAEGFSLGNGTIAGAAIGSTRAMAIGHGAQSLGGDSLVVGNGAAASETSFFAENVVIGRAAVAQIGAFQSIVIGYSANAAHDSAIVLGSRITSDFARQFKVGFGAGGVQGLPIYGVFIGGRDQYAGYEGITYRHVNGLGADNSVGPLQFISPLGTGNGRAAVGGLFAGIEFYTGAVPAGSGSAVQAQTLNFKVLPQTSPAPTNTDAPVAFPNYFDGANGQIGTLNNAPKAGDPQAWLPFNLKGVVHWVPCWHL